jgi:hypothetical protein
MGSGSGSQIGVGWERFRYIVGGGDGMIYAVESTGALRWYQDIMRNGANGPRGEAGWAVRSGSATGGGWQHFLHVFSGKPGQLFGVQSCDFGPYVVQYIDKERNGIAGWRQIGDVWTARSDAYFSCGWQVAKTEGYSWPLSIAPGEKAQFFISVMNDGPAEAEIVRLTGRGPDLAVKLSDRQPRVFSAKFQPDNGFDADCGWPATFDLPIPQDAVFAGFYAARVLGPSGPEYDIPFIVKQGVAPGNIALVVNTNTWNAYNFWGGASNYSSTQSPIELSCKRPNFHLLTNSQDHVNGNHMLRGEIWLLDWLQSRGYSIDLITDLDLHARPDLSCYKAVILSTHPEYWTPEMMGSARAYLDGGGSLLYLGGNGAYRPTQLRTQTGMGPVDLMQTASVSWNADEFATYEGKPLFAARVDIQRGGGTGRGVVLHPGVSFVPASAPTVLVGTKGWNGPPFGQAEAYGASGWETEPWPLPLPGDVVELGRDPTENGSGAVIATYKTRAGGFVLGVGSITFVGGMIEDANLSGLVTNALAEGLSR